MPITRSVWIDDDGSGTTGTPINNAELQKIYTNIDGMIATGSWIPTDASGAGLTFTVISGCRYWKLDKLVTLIGNFSFPVTSNTAAAKIGGLPFPNGSTVGAVSSMWLAAKHPRIQPNTSEILYFDVAGGAMTNANMSGQVVVLGGFYLIA